MALAVWAAGKIEVKHMMRLQIATAAVCSQQPSCYASPDAARLRRRCTASASITVMPRAAELSDHEGSMAGWPQTSRSKYARVEALNKVNFTDGQFVKKGDLLFELDPRPFQAEIGKAQDKIRIYEAQKIAADRDTDRYRELVPQRAASQKELDKAIATGASLGAEIAASQNEVQRVKLDLEYSRITADIAGRVGRAELIEGNLVHAGGSDPLLTSIVSVTPIRIYFNVDER